jgi:hypothetical protein
VSLGVATRTERAQVLGTITPAQLTGDDVIDLGGERPTSSAAEAVAPEHLEPQRSPGSGRSSAARMLGAGLRVQASRHRADGERSSRHRPTMPARGDALRRFPNWGMTPDRPRGDFGRSLQAPGGRARCSRSRATRWPRSPRGWGTRRSSLPSTTCSRWATTPRSITEQRSTAEPARECQACPSGPVPGPVLVARERTFSLLRAFSPNPAGGISQAVSMGRLPVVATAGLQ